MIVLTLRPSWSLTSDFTKVTEQVISSKYPLYNFSVCTRHRVASSNVPALTRLICKPVTLTELVVKLPFEGFLVGITAGVTEGAIVCNDEGAEEGKSDGVGDETSAAVGDKVEGVGVTGASVGTADGASSSWNVMGACAGVNMNGILTGKNAADTGMLIVGASVGEASDKGSEVSDGARIMSSVMVGPGVAVAMPASSKKINETDEIDFMILFL